MIKEVLVVDVQGEVAGRLLVEKPKRGLGAAFTLVMQGRAIVFGTNETQTHELQRAIELVSEVGEE